MSTDAAASSEREPADAKAWFYLDNREDIEEWAALRTVGRDLLDRHLVAMADEIEAWAATEGAEFYARELDGGSFPRTGLRRPSWRFGEVEDVSVLVEWERARLLMPGGRGGNQWPYVAVRVSPRQSDESRRQAIFEAINPVRKRLGYQRSTRFTYNWAMWQYVTATNGRGIDPGQLVSDCMMRLQAAWREAAPVIDALHK